MELDDFLRFIIVLLAGVIGALTAEELPPAVSWHE